MNLKTTTLTLLFSVLLQLSFAQGNNYQIGAGIYDITGQIAQTNFFGYADPFFGNRGIKDRQYARAFIIKDRQNNSVVFVSIDKGATFQSVNLEVMKKLKAKFGDLYTDTNVVISATHTHVSPGGYSYYELYNTSVGGFYQTNFDVLVDGIVRAISDAHDNMASGKVFINKGTLKNASINRSLVAYNDNKDANDYPSINEEMTVLKFIQGNKEIGMISWFGVHTTSLSNSYRYCSGDNKGYASLKFERMKDSSYGKGNETFVAAFANTNAGDLSPNLNLPPADDYSNDATGPGRNEEESAAIIGNRQYQKALELYNSASEQLTGNIQSVSRYSDFSNITVDPKFTSGRTEKTCKAALGTSFRGGAEDGRSGLGREGNRRNNPNSGNADQVCHQEKVMAPLFFIGENEDNPRTPKILPSSILKVGQLAILAAPAEFTVMSGRRVKATVASHTELGLDHIVFADFSDAYAGYVTTREEYASQQYEGASTHFGPWTLAAYRQEFDRLCQQLDNASNDPWGNPAPTPPNMSNIGSDTTVEVLFDNTGGTYGETFSDVEEAYVTGETAKVSFIGGHPNNDPKVNDTYFTVEKRQGNEWKVVYEDRDFNTKLIWERIRTAASRIHIEFEITPEVESGTYRIVHTGKWKSGWNGRLYNYRGVSSTFTVNTSSQSRSIDTEFTENKSTASDIIVFPNPTAGLIKIINSLQAKGTYKVVTSTGRMIETGLLSDDLKQSVSLDYPSGIYKLIIELDNGTVYRNTIIKR